MFWPIFIALLVQIYAIEDDTKDYYFEFLHQWHRVEYQFPSEAERTEAIKNGSFRIDIIRPVDAQYTYHAKTQQDRYFITVPRRQLKGTPASLGVINTTEPGRNETHVLDPYPSWSWHIDPEKCNYYRIVNVYRVWADECSRLWVMDNAKLDDGVLCPPQILVFDLETDTLIFKYELPYEQYQNESFYLTPIAEVESMEDNCKKTWLYVADPIAPRLLVYNLEKNVSWTIQDETFKPVPKYEKYTIAGDTFYSPNGIVSLALSPKCDPPGKRKLYYHSMSDVRQFWVYIKYLKNPDNFKTPYGSPQLFYTYPTKLDQQTSVEAVDCKGIMYFGLLTDILLVKWDPNTPYSKENFVVIADNKTAMQFPTSVKVVPHNGTEYLYVFPTANQRYPKPLDADKVNFRLFRTKL
ncbi:major royal jelly protein 1-like isoform X3 [Anthonomus grandis grandis]|uniref:major royal jelly protein 1-like isoform X2 n=1 Tax=Anthonomus grandis grandis TaxID=2921223 RepID=UPI00216577D8|nr:major royal jelly protein 1-like isoform X2 [Anthonomus grandis grandis]XP_050292709.1 major royal jelly protein 1-like isoform X3 [Anthonomus grandis grandis]